MIKDMANYTKNSPIYSVLLVFLAFCVMLLGCRVYALDQQLHSIMEKNSGLAFSQSCSDKTFDYLAIGNSITIHETCDYWWNEIGMAASETDKDYYHIVSNWLGENRGAVNSAAVGFSMWETLATDRAEMVVHIEDYLCDELELITVQLGENVTNLETFHTDFKYLIQYIQENAVNAKIIMIGDFWRYANRDEIKKVVSEECGVVFLDLSEIVSNPAYQCGLGTSVVDPYGNTHIVEHAGVAAHPGDAGMQFIAEGVIGVLSNDFDNG